MEFRALVVRCHWAFHNSTSSIFSQVWVDELCTKRPLYRIDTNDRWCDRDESAVEDLARYAESGVEFVFINVGMDSTAPLDTLKVLSALRHRVAIQVWR